MNVFAEHLIGAAVVGQQEHDPVRPGLDRCDPVQGTAPVEDCEIALLLVELAGAGPLTRHDGIDGITLYCF